VDEIILFHALTRAELGEIVGIQIERLCERLAEQKISLKLMEGARNYLTEVGYDPVYGARPLKRAIQRELENPIATLLLEGKFVAGDTIYIHRAKEGLRFDNQPPSASVNPVGNSSSTKGEAPSAKPLQHSEVQPSPWTAETPAIEVKSEEI
jgi:ATP-dependent Clp protease ATP-binding subunit ClpB